MKTDIPLQRLQPVPILLTTYNRLGFLKTTIEEINSRTLYPFYLFVVDNNSSDGTRDYLKVAKTNGKIFDFQIMSENVGQSKALNHIFSYMESWQEKRQMENFVVSTNDDIVPSKLSPCWLERMIKIFEDNEKDGLGALAMRIQRTARMDIDNSKDVLYWNKGIPSVFRLMRRSDLRQLGEDVFGHLSKWDSNSTADKFKFFLKKRYGLTTHIYADHIGWCPRKGYDVDTETFTLAENKLKEAEEKPYPEIDPETNEPIKVNSPYDFHEQEKRDEHRAKKVIELSSKKESLRTLYENEPMISLRCAMDRASEFYGELSDEKIVEYLDKFLQ